VAVPGGGADQGWPDVLPRLLLERRGRAAVGDPQRRAYQGYLTKIRLPGLAASAARGKDSPAQK
jgi:hypothetical protein